MGVPMAGRLVAAGHDVTVWNRTPAKAAPLEAAGAGVATTPADAVAGHELVITMLSDPAAVTEVLFGVDGGAGGLTSSATVVEMSTIGPAAIADIRAKLREGVRLLDAPVLGSCRRRPRVSYTSSSVAGRRTSTAAVTFSPCSARFTTLANSAPARSSSSTWLPSRRSSCSVRRSHSLGGSDSDRAGTLDALSRTSIGPLINRISDRIGNPNTPTQFALGLAEKDLGLAVDAGAPADGLIEAGLGDRDISAILGFLSGEAF